MTAAPLLATGCGAGVPLLHSAHPLDPGEVSVGAGTSAQMVRGPLATSLRDAKQSQDQGKPADTAVGAVLRASAAPGVAPWVGTRIGLGYGSDAGLSYTGREVRLDAQRGWTDQAWAVSVGAGLAGILSRQLQGGDDHNAAERVRANTLAGLALDVPLLVGWRSEPDVVQLWAGVRGGYERLRGSVQPPQVGGDSVSPSLDVSASRWYAGPLVGLAVGVEPLWVAFELAGSYQAIRGMLRETPGRASDSEEAARPILDSGQLRFTTTGYALAPAAGLVGRF